MTIRMKAAACGVLLMTVVGAVKAQAQYSDQVVRIGVLNDQSGPFADATGEGSVVAARLAVEEFGEKIGGAPIEIVVGDHTNKSDRGAVIARQWYDRDGVDIIVDIGNSAVSLAVANLAIERNKLVIHNSGSSEITGKSCGPSSIQWTFNSYANAKAFAQSVLQQDGRNSWFIILADYAFGTAMAADLRRFVERSGGTVLGEVRHPPNGSDFSSFLLQAQASKAKVIALASAASDLANLIKQADEFKVGRDGSQILVTPTPANQSEIDALGLNVAQGLQTMSLFEWNRNEATRAWTKRFMEKFGKFPTANQAAVYSEVRHYLRAVEAVGTDSTAAVLAKMRELPVQDIYAENGKLREDGQMIHDLFVVRVKTPGESKEKGDYFNLVRSVSGEEAFQTLAESQCPLVKK